MGETPNLTCFYFTISWDKTDEVFVTNIVTCILNSLFSVLTFMGNLTVLHAIRKARDLHAPSFTLLCCIAVPDLLVGAVCQPLFVSFTIAKLMDNFSAYCTLRMLADISGYTTTGVSLLTLAAVSIDRLLALTLPLRYHTIVTVPRVFQTAFILWIFAIICIVPKFWLRNADWIFLPLVILLFTLIVITFSTCKIFYTVRRHQRQINDQTMATLSLQTNTANVLKCKKSSVTVLYVYGLFLISYLPFCLLILVEARVGNTRNMGIAFDYAATVVFINSFINPLVYCWRIREIRRAVKNVVRRRGTVPIKNRQSSIATWHDGL